MWLCGILRHPGTACCQRRWQGGQGVGGVWTETGALVCYWSLPILRFSVWFLSPIYEVTEERGNPCNLTLRRSHIGEQFGAFLLSHCR